MSEPTLEEWFAIMLSNRDLVKKHLSGYNEHQEVYESIAEDADRQIRALSNTFRLLATHMHRAEKNTNSSPAPCNSGESD